MPAPNPSTPAAATLPQVKHLVVLMMENRSLDNLLGFLYPGNRAPHVLPPGSSPLYDGLLTQEKWNQLTPDSPRVYASQGTGSMRSPHPDPNEDFKDMTEQIFGTGTTATMLGFLSNYATANPGSPGQIMQSYSPDQVPVISQLARSFAVSDAWFASAPCQTWPNRGFVHTGSSDGHINNDDYEPYDIETVFNVLTGQGVPWAVCNNTWLQPSLVRVMFPRLWDDTRHFHGMGRFYDACRAPAAASAANKLPAYTFLEPNFLDPDESYHPPHHVQPAERFLAQVYDALRACPYRDDVLFVITFDEHGGCYDHVPPGTGAMPPRPGAVSRDGHFPFDRFGVRVPAIVVSSYVEPGTVFRAPGSTPFDHTSILATLRDWLGGTRPGFAQRFAEGLPSPRIAAAPTLSGLLTRASPQAWPALHGEPGRVAVLAAELAGVLETLDDLQRSLLIGEISMRAGAYIGHAAVAEWRQRLRTVGDARRHLASRVRPG